MNEQFEGQRNGENVEVYVRTHPMRFLWPGIKTVLIFLVPVASYIFFGANLYTSIVILIFVVWGLFEAIEEWYEYSNDLCIITNHRVLCIEQEGFFKREIAEAELDKIQEVEYTTKGLLETTFNFGDVSIQTASSHSNIVLKDVPRPYSVQQEITKRIKGVHTPVES